MSATSATQAPPVPSHADGDPTAAADCATLATAFPTVAWGTNCCLFAGVNCAGGRVTDLNLHDQTLGGPLPQALSTLTELLTIHLEGNAFTGPIPDFMGTLSKLDTLWLFGNQLSGAIPASLGNLKLMQSLRLEGNRLSGAIPDSLGSLPKLFSFHVENNAGLTGTLPRFAANIDCGAAGTQLCLATGVTASFCKLPFCDPSANVATSSASATSAGPSPTTIVGDSAASSSSSSSTLSTGAIAGIVAAGAVVFIAGVFLVARARKRAAEDAGRGYSLPSHKRGDRRAVVEVGGPRV